MQTSPIAEVKSSAWDWLGAGVLLLAILAVRHGRLWWGFLLVSVVCAAVLRMRNPVRFRIFEFVREESRRDPRFWMVAGVIAAGLLVLQLARGAYQAEFTGHPDEAAHFVSALMVHDYLAAWPDGKPFDWAVQYYLHYPAVAIGHWPPGYHALLAIWWLLTTPARATALVLHWGMGALALILLYRLARSRCSFAVSCALVCGVAATPVFQQALERTMADLLCFLWGVLLLGAVTRLVEGEREAALAVALILLGAAATKGNAVCLMPVPVVAFAMSSRRRRQGIDWGRAVIGLVLLGGAGLLYLNMGQVAYWGGMSISLPWPVKTISVLAGWGALALAALGVSRDPLPLVAGSAVASAVGVSFVVRAMQEDRHWIIVLPAIALLCGFAVAQWWDTRRMLVAPLLLAALLLFPYSVYRQSPAGFTNAMSQVRRPSRTLVSSRYLGEGPLVAAAALAAQTRPGDSTVLRATKVFTRQGWNGENYRLLAASREAVATRLDELGVDAVVLHSPPVAGRRWIPRHEHHELIRETLAGDPAAWTRCGVSGDLLEIYCRAKPPATPRRPFRLELRGWTFEEK